MHSQAFGNGQDDLPIRDARADLFGNMDRGQQGPLLMAGRTGNIYKRSRLILPSGKECVSI